MAEIPPVTKFDSIDASQTCQEASSQSGHRYIACGMKACAIVSSYGVAYYMCFDCTMRNLRERGAALIYATDKGLARMIADKTVKVIAAPDLRDKHL